MREHLQSVYRQTGVLPAELENAVEVPATLEYLWNWFLELHRARGSNGYGPDSLSYTEILAWSTLTGRIIEPWEVQILKDIDTSYLINASEAATD